MMHKTKKIIILLLAITTFTNKIPKANAFTNDFGYVNVGGEGYEREYPQATLGVTSDTYYLSESYICEYGFLAWPQKKVTINGYDINNTSLMEHSINISKENAITAGTAISLNIYESKIAWWKVDHVKVEKVTNYKVRKYNCYYNNRNTGQLVANTNDHKTTFFPTTLENNNPKSNIMTIAQPMLRKEVYYSSQFMNASICHQYNPDPSTYEYSYYELASDYVTGTYDTRQEVTSGPYYDECEKTAVEAAIGTQGWQFNASYNIEMSDSNDVKGNDKVIITKDEVNETIKCQDRNGNNINCEAGRTAFTYQPGVLEDYINMTFEYKINNVCMNVKTSKVTYRSGVCQNDEVKVPNKIYNGKEYWNYFTPLNSKSNSDIEINMKPSDGGYLEAGYCIDQMQKYPVVVDARGNIVEEILGSHLATTYVNLINPISGGEPFKGNYCKKSQVTGIVTCNEHSSDYQEVMNNGCYLTSKIKIPVKQKFYNENQNGTTVKFDGFNFYYKPIDASKATSDNQDDIIFPNGALDNGVFALLHPSLWAEWYSNYHSSNAAKKALALDLSKSYKDITYYANNINANTIREYNANYPYTSWDNMFTTGISSFIESKGIITRNVARDSFYKLGCGPANSDPNSLLYINGCERS